MNKRGPARKKSGTKRVRRGNLGDDVIPVARQLIEDEGPDALSLAKIQKRFKLLNRKVSITAPLHHFASMEGLHAAVASRGFDELAVDLEQARKEAKPESVLLVLAVRYVEFALERRNLYLVMHHPRVWQAVEDLEAARSGVSGAELPKAAEEGWLNAVEESRNQVFAEFVFATQLGQAAGTIRSDLTPDDPARLVTALVDGFLFQTLAEHVRSQAPADELRHYVSLAIEGLSDSGWRRQHEVDLDP